MKQYFFIHALLISAGLLTALLVFSSSVLHAEEYLTREEALALAFPGADSIDKVEVKVSADAEKKILELSRAKKIPGTFQYYKGVKDGKVMGYALIQDVPGKHKPITFMTSVDEKFNVQAVEIMVYRESIGSEIKQKSFRKQFYGKTAKDAVKLNSDVKNISGATISCRSVCEGVHQALCVLGVLVPEQQENDVGPDCKEFSRCRLLMGTTLELRVYAQDEKTADRWMDGAFDRVKKLEEKISTYIPESEISALNRSAGKEAVALSDETLDLIQKSLELHRKSSAAFNICVGPLVSLWQKADGKEAPPSSDEISAAKKLLDCEGIRIDMKNKTAKLSTAGMALDFGGIGKGYALDLAASAMKKAGAKSALLNFGGNILVFGLPPKQKHWDVSLRDPAKKPDSVSHVLRLKEGSISVSADYERALRIGGKTYSHIIDPRSGEPVSGMLDAVICAGTATEADALSTALFVMGRKEGAEFARKESLALLMRVLDEDPVVTAKMSSLFENEGGKK